jgi:AraC family transcriptional regulator
LVLDNFIEKVLKLSSHYPDSITEFCPRREGNMANRSRLTSISAYVPRTPCVGIKYVITGMERYVVNGKEHRVSEGQYLLVNKDQELSVEFKNPEMVEGICIYLDETLVRNACQYLSVEEKQLIDNPFDREVSLPEFNETVYSAGSGLSRFLKKVVNDCRRPNPVSFYHDVAVELVRTQVITSEQMQKIKAAKASTKKELFNRLNHARMILDEDRRSGVTISELAREVSLSEFHFLRSFKAAFGCTPHQYLLSKRLHKAMTLLKGGKLSVTETAYASGFNDVFSFSKTFKKQFGVTPSSIATRNSNRS